MNASEPENTNSSLFGNITERAYIMKVGGHAIRRQGMQVFPREMSYNSSGIKKLNLS